MQYFPQICNLFKRATQLAITQISPNHWTVSKILVLGFPKNWWFGIIPLFSDTRLFWNIVVLWAASAHSWFQSDNVNVPPFSMALTWLCSVANYLSTLSFYWGVLGAVYSKNIPNPSCLNAFSNEIISLALTKQIIIFAIIHQIQFLYELNHMTLQVTLFFQEITTVIVFAIINDHQPVLSSSHTFGWR